MHSLSKDEINRFSRQLILPEIGVKGQERLKEWKVLIVGGGGLGCPLAIYLAAGGVGQLGIVDYDCVETNNLHRQILHTEDGVGTSKADSIRSAVKKHIPLAKHARHIARMESCLGSYAQKMFLFDGLEGQSRTINLRPRNLQCEICGDSPSIKELIEYEAFCGAGACDKTKSVCLLAEGERIPVGEYKEVMESGLRHVLIDTRPKHEFEICRIPASIIYVVCRRGNDSQEAVLTLKDKLKHTVFCQDENLVIKDLTGGLESWAKEIDQNFPLY